MIGGNKEESRTILGGFPKSEAYPQSPSKIRHELSIESHGDVGYIPIILETTSGLRPRPVAPRGGAFLVLIQGEQQLPSRHKAPPSPVTWDVLIVVWQDVSLRDI